MASKIYGYSSAQYKARPDQQPGSPWRSGFANYSTTGGASFSGALDAIKSNTLFPGEFNSRPANQVANGVLSGAEPRTGWPRPTANGGQEPSYAKPLSSISTRGGAMSSAAAASGIAGVAAANPLLAGVYTGISNQLNAAGLLATGQRQPVTPDTAMMDTNHDGFIDPFEML